MDLNKVQDTIIEEFELMVDQVKSKFKYLRHFAEMGAKPALNVIERTNEKLIRLTKSRIWLDAEYLDGKVYYYGDSDSKIIRGYWRCTSGFSPEEHPRRSLIPMCILPMKSAFIVIYQLKEEMMFHLFYNGSEP
ncbi:SufE family protein [Niabella hibiscisoli]|nr:SufE family protein [Niabella hibiscisoli]MCH5720933.1 SufE family protein [Niabella hibiscisoli]